MRMADLNSSEIGRDMGAVPGCEVLHGKSPVTLHGPKLDLKITNWRQRLLFLA